MHRNEEHEYRLTGRLWARIGGILLCVIAIGLIRLTPTRVVHGPLRLLNLAPAQADLIIQIICGSVAVLLAAWALASPWVARRLLVTSNGLTIFEPKIFGGSSIFVPLYTMEGMSVTIAPITLGGNKALTRLQETVQFYYDGSTFSVTNWQFRSNDEFEDFCIRLGATY